MVIFRSSDTHNNLSRCQRLSQLNYARVGYGESLPPFALTVLATFPGKALQSFLSFLLSLLTAYNRTPWHCLLTRPIFKVVQFIGPECNIPIWTLAGARYRCCPKRQSNPNRKSRGLKHATCVSNHKALFFSMRLRPQDEVDYGGLGLVSSAQSDVLEPCPCAAWLA